MRYAFAFAASFLRLVAEVPSLPLINGIEPATSDEQPIVGLRGGAHAITLPGEKLKLPGEAVFVKSDVSKI